MRHSVGMSAAVVEGRGSGGGKVEVVDGEGGGEAAGGERGEARAKTSQRGLLSIWVLAGLVLLAVWMLNVSLHVPEDPPPLPSGGGLVGVVSPSPRAGEVGALPTPLGGRGAGAGEGEGEKECECVCDAPESEKASGASPAPAASPSPAGVIPAPSEVAREAVDWETVRKGIERYDIPAAPAMNTFGGFSDHRPLVRSAALRMTRVAEARGSSWEGPRTAKAIVDYFNGNAPMALAWSPLEGALGAQSQLVFNVSGMNWAVGRNMCIKTSHPRRVVLFHKEGQPRPLASDYRPISTRWFKYWGFGWGWEFDVRSVPASVDLESYYRSLGATWYRVGRGPSVEAGDEGPGGALDAAARSMLDARYGGKEGGWKAEGTWVGWAPFANHIYHHAEGHHGIFAASQRRAQFPPIDRYVGMDANDKDFYPMTRLLWDLETQEAWQPVSDATPPAAWRVSSAAGGWGEGLARVGNGSQGAVRGHAEVYTNRFLATLARGKDLLCFEQLNLMGRITFPAMGGMYVDLADADIFREAAYRKLHMQFLPPPVSGLRVFIIARKKGSSNGRQFKNPELIAAICKKLKLDVAWDNHPLFGQMGAGAGMDAEARWMANADILVGAHGQGLSNMLLMRRGSAVIEVNPWGYQNIIYDAEAWGSGLGYMEVQGEKPKPYPGCEEPGMMWSYNYVASLGKCRSAFHASEVIVNANAMETALRKLMVYVSFHKYGGKRFLGPQPPW